ncbi:MAG: T9SS type A sorting domain-containing protein [Saprospiraceae bacterium]
MKKLLLLFVFFLSLNFAQAQDTLCYVVVNQVQGGFCLQATAYGTPPFVYSWDNGDVGDTTCPNDTLNYYCVTVIDADSCVSTACGILDSPTNCSVNIVNLNSALTAQTTGFGTYDFLWSTGATTESILPAQPGEYCVSISDNLGCQASACYTLVDTTLTNCTINITVDPTTGLTANATGTAPYTYTWSNSANTQSIFPLGAGSYCVSIVDATGCVSEACAYWAGNPADSCDVIISQGILGAPISSLSATPSGTGPYTYQWSTGDTSSIILPTLTGTYCVTVTNADGCIASNCTFWTSPTPDSCTTYLQYTNFDSLYNLIAIPNGVAPFSYLWSDGSTGAGILVDTLLAANYCVTVTDATGCVATACYDLSQFFTIYGDVVFANIDSLNTPILQGEVYLIQYNPVDNSLVAIDSVSVTGFPFGNTMSYSFSGLAPGEYLVKAALNPASNGYDDYLPTYHYSELFWNDATTLNIPGLGAGYRSIFMIEGDNPGGPGFIGGFVSEGANLTGGAAPRGEGDPIANANIILLDDNDQPVAHSKTDAAGNFSFENLAWGTYKVYIEILGMEPSFAWVTIGPDDETIDNVSFVVSSDGVEAVVTSISEVIATETVRLFPNPIQTEAYLELEGKTATEGLLTIVNLQGQTVMTQVVSIAKGHQYLGFNAEKLTPGMYFLNLQINKEVISKKMIKQ